MLINKKIYFIHIPRTGGQYIKGMLYNNFDNLDHNNYNRFYKDKESPHLTYPEYHEFINYIPVKHFTIVRNPLDRIISVLKIYNKFNEEKLDMIFKNQSSFDDFVNLTISNCNGNWFMPQVRFINHQTKIWKFEDKFNDEFYYWLFINLGLNVKIKEGDLSRYNKFKIKIDLTNKQKQFIENYYYQDYKILNY